MVDGIMKKKGECSLNVCMARHRRDMNTGQGGDKARVQSCLLGSEGKSDEPYYDQVRHLWHTTQAL